MVNVEIEVNERDGSPVEVSVLYCQAINSVLDKSCLVSNII